MRSHVYLVNSSMFIQTWLRITSNGSVLGPDLFKLMNQPLSLGKFIAISVELGGVKRPITEISNFKNAAFEKEQDQIAFCDLMSVEFPNERFVKGTLNGFYCVQLASW